MTNGQNVHWRKRHAEAKKWKKLTSDQILDLITKHSITSLPLNKATLTLTRHSAKEPDFDGLVSGFKHIIDSLVETGFLINDKQSTIGQPTYQWKTAARNRGFVFIQIEI